MFGLSGSESTVVEAPEKSVGRVVFVSALLRDAVDVSWSSPEESWTWVLKDSEERRARRGGDGGRHSAQASGSI